MSEAFDYPLPPTSVPHPAAPPMTPSAVKLVPAPAPPAPESDEVTALRKRVAELEHVMSLAKTRFEALGAEKREALERASRLEAELESARQSGAEIPARVVIDEPPVAPPADPLAELVKRIAALEAIVSPPPVA